MADPEADRAKVQPPIEPSPTQRRRWSVFGLRLRYFLLGLAIPAVLAVLYLWVALSYTYSEGERAGYVKSFSRRGWVCKTWEGELAVVAIPGATPETFAFTVKSNVTAEAINHALGTPVRLHYRQHVGIPCRCFGETAFYVDAVAPAEGILPAPTPTPLAQPTPTQPTVKPAATPAGAR
jgi:hypothetical protein